jgi:hypothetical protein
VHFGPARQHCPADGHHAVMRVGAQLDAVRVLEMHTETYTVCVCYTKDRRAHKRNTLCVTPKIGEQHNRQRQAIKQTKSAADGATHTQHTVCVCVCVCVCVQGTPEATLLSGRKQQRHSFLETPSLHWAAAVSLRVCRASHGARVCRVCCVLAPSIAPSCSCQATVILCMPHELLCIQG